MLTRFTIFLKKKTYYIIAELVQADENFEVWKISQRETPEKFIYAVSDRPQMLKIKPTEGRYNWWIDDAPVTNDMLLSIINKIEWRQWFIINDGYAGVHVRDDF